jgi:hypothetical protein
MLVSIICVDYVGPQGTCADHVGLRVLRSQDQTDYATSSILTSFESLVVFFECCTDRTTTKSDITAYDLAEFGISSCSNMDIFYCCQ